ncbi:recombinase family protein [Microbacterium sp. HA-8]|uniref:recombinase family protein n=1 Tax=Microbacterium sp. HA-8 TaxID=3234200 RepID=UPI0038F74820
MHERDERGKNYIADATPVDGGGDALEAPKGLDFPAEKSVNPEDLTEGGPHMYQEGEEAAATLAKPNLTSVAGLEHLFKGDDAMHVPLRTAVAISYLRVSTTRQLNTAADLDEDGNSIATQREWVIRKAKELGVPILREFVEPGQSAQTIDKRPEFKKLLRFVDANPDIRYVVIYMRSRVFRNHLDAAIGLTPFRRSSRYESRPVVRGRGQGDWSDHDEQQEASHPGAGRP